MSTTHHFPNPAGWTIEANPIGRPFAAHDVARIFEADARGIQQAIDAAVALIPEAGSARIYHGGILVENGKVTEGTFAGTVYVTATGIVDWAPAAEAFLA